MKKILMLVLGNLIATMAFAAPPMSGTAPNAGNISQSVDNATKQESATITQGQVSQLQDETARLNQLSSQLRTQTNLLNVQCPTQPYSQSCQQLEDQVQALQKQNTQLKNTINQNKTNMQRMHQQQLQQSNN